MYLGKNIQYLRKQRKITQERFSEQMAVSRQTVTKWEAGVPKDVLLSKASFALSKQRAFGPQPDSLLQFIKLPLPLKMHLITPKST